MASSSRNNETWKHDVFLSFRGAETRNTFTAHLYRALHDKGVNVFLDNEIQRGEIVTSELRSAIEKSRISIVVLSEKYASSSFCLDELEKILESRESKGQIVIPVFYHVDPSDVEVQSGTIGQEFDKLEAQLNKDLNYWKLFPAKAASFIRNVGQMWPIVDDLEEQSNDDDKATNMKRVQKWRLALSEVARFSGYHLKKWDHESSIIQDIVKTVCQKLAHTPLHVAEHPVGVTSRVEKILWELTLESQDVCVVGLWGMGGIGKTTIAKALYNRCAIQFEFDGRCFLSNVGEKSKTHGIAHLQGILLSEISGDQVHMMKFPEEGIIKGRLQNKKVLIVIDGVDHCQQLQQLVGGVEWFGAGSKIIITTRDLGLLEQHGVTMIHEIKKLEFDEALQLFSWHAFKKHEPDDAYIEFSDRLIRYSEGLPIALAVLGSSLYKKSAAQWDDMLNKLQRFPNEMIYDALKTSYDSLDSESKAIFLDIAVHFKGKHKDEVTKFLDACGFRARYGIKRLIDSSLVYDASNGTLEMHDLLEELGTKIALEESSRLCIRKRKDFHRLFVKDKRAYDVEILVLDLHEEEEEELPLNWLENLTKLRALVIRNGRFTKMPRKLPDSIKWLEWHNRSLKSIPSGFLPTNLVVLEMPHSNIKKILADKSKEPKFLNLTRMDFTGSEYLREMVDFSSIPNVEVLDLKECKNLKKIHTSVGSLKKLEKLDLLGCLSLTSLPSLFDNQRLKLINLSHCSKLESLPNLPTALTRLDMEKSYIREIPLFIGNLTNLKYIEASHCKNLTFVSDSIYKLPFIEHLSLNNCPNLVQLPEAEISMVLSNPTLTTVNFLDLSGNKFVSLPRSTFKFIHITCLILNNCQWLVEVPELPHTLEFLEARNCKSLVRFSQFQFDRFEGDFSNCHKIEAGHEMQSWRETVAKVSMKKEDDPSWKYCVTLPGNKIPEWFSYVTKPEAAIPSFHLSSPASNNDLIGIAWCVAFQYPHPQKPRPCVPSEVTFKMNDSSIETLNLSDPLESEHVWFGFCAGFDLPQFSKGKSILFKFESSDTEAVSLGDLGVHFIYKK